MNKTWSRLILVVAGMLVGFMPFLLNWAVIDNSHTWNGGHVTIFPAETNYWIVPADEKEVTIIPDDEKNKRGEPYVTMADTSKVTKWITNKSVFPERRCTNALYVAARDNPKHLTNCTGQLVEWKNKNWYDTNPPVVGQLWAYNPIYGMTGINVEKYDAVVFQVGPEYVLCHSANDTNWTTNSGYIMSPLTNWSRYERLIRQKL
jgi:hypothetical protein